MVFSGDLLHKIQLGLFSCSKSSCSIAQLSPAATPGAEGQAKGRLSRALSPKQAGGSGAAFSRAGMLLQEKPCGDDRAAFPSGGPLYEFLSVACFHVDLQIKPYSMIQISMGLPVPSQG